MGTHGTTTGTSSSGSGSTSTASTSTGTSSTATSSTSTSATGTTSTGTSSTSTSSTGTSATGTSSTGTTGTTGTTGSTGTTGGGNGNDEDEEDGNDHLKIGFTGPELISGTNVKIGINVSGIKTHHPETVQVTLEDLTDGTIPTTLYFASGNTTASVSLLIKLDSTHFEPGDHLLFKVHTKDEEGEPLDSEFDTHVYNRFERLYSQEFGRDLQNLPQVTNFAKYTSNYKLHPWALSQAKTSMRDASVFFISTHGLEDSWLLMSTKDPTVPDNDSATPDVDPLYYIFPVDATDSRRQASEMKLPPISLAFIYACSTGHRGSPSPLFSGLILRDWGNTEDRAILQFKERIYNGLISSPTDPLTQAVDGIFNRLSQKDDLQAAVLSEQSHLLAGCDPYYTGGPYLNQYILIEGDPGMTLRGLYDATPSERLGGKWYKVQRQ